MQLECIGDLEFPGIHDFFGDEWPTFSSMDLLGSKTSSADLSDLVESMISTNLGRGIMNNRASSGWSNQLGPEFGYGLTWALGNIISPTRIEFFLFH
jgi:hypothetical protein